jgi:hypothetical protein
VIGDKKTYVVPEKNWLRSVATGQWIGSTFKDHGKTMQIEEVGHVYTGGKERLVDIEAIEIASAASQTCCGQDGDARSGNK